MDLRRTKAFCSSCQSFELGMSIKALGNRMTHPSIIHIRKGIGGGRQRQARLASPHFLSIGILAHTSCKLIWHLRWPTLSLADRKLANSGFVTTTWFSWFLDFEDRRRFHWMSTGLECLFWSFVSRSFSTAIFVSDHSGVKELHHFRNHKDRARVGSW